MQQNIRLKILTSLWLLTAFLFCICAGTNAYAQTNPVKGKVVNENGSAVPGATVAIKGTNIGTTTNDNGDFIIETANKDASLIISSIGYERQELSLDGKTNITITLKQKASELDQAIVIAYGTTTKRLNTGDVSKVTAEEIERQPVSNPLAALEGRVSGLVVTQNTGVPGGSFTVRIRGQNSIANGNDPLYVVDGVPFSATPITSGYLNASIIDGGSPLANINPSDIESIEILKDADATAIYGSRGANGVVLITTKKGKAGKTKIDFNIYTGIGKVGRMMQLLNTPEYLQMRHEAFKNDGAIPQSYDYDINGAWDTTRYTDWQKVLIGGTAHVTNAQASISGGNTNTQFLISSGYYKEGTVFPGDFGTQKGSVHFNLAHTSNSQKFKLTLSANYVADKNNLFAYDLTTYIPVLAPDAPPIYDSSGHLNWANGSWSNPFADLLIKYTSNTNNIISNSIMSYDIIPGLQIKASIGYSRMQTDEIQVNPLGSFNPAYGLTQANTFTYFSNGSRNTWILEPQVNYHKPLLRGMVEILAGATFQQDFRQEQTLNATGFNNDALMENIAAAASLTIVDANYIQYRYSAVFGRINYNLKDEFLINLTGRRDGSSRFGPGKQFANFGAVGAGWVFSKEKFVQSNLSFLSFGKVRASYGTVGNDQIGDYQYLSTWTSTRYPYQGSSGLYPTRLFNPDFAWEVTRKLEAGLELGFFKDRVLFTASYYRNRSSNQLVGYPLAPSTGFVFVQSNLNALVQNSGTELEINSDNIKTNNFSWNTSVNLTIPSNKLLAFPNLAGSFYNYKYVVGKSLGVVRAFHYTGVNPQSGVYEFVTKNANGIPSSPGDLQAFKQVAQRFYGGLQNSFQYKSWQMDIFFQFVKQTAPNYINSFSMPGSAGNQPTIVMSRWQKPGDIANIQQFTQDYGSPAGTAYFNSQFYGDNRIGDASFIRLKNFSLSYRIGEKCLKKMHLQNCRIYAQGQNLFTITRYLGFDPETQAALPPIRILTVGLQITL